MATTEVTLTDWYWGEDRIFEFQVAENGVFQNITGWTFQWHLRAADDDLVALLAKTSAAGGVVITNAALGILEVRIAKADTDPAGANEVLPGPYRHGLARIDAGFWNVLAFGPATLSKAPVRP